MDSKIALLFSLFLVFSYSNAFNITQILGQYKDFSTFNSYLTQTQVATQINTRQTITILAVDNSAMPSLSSKPADIIKNIMSVHIVLDYYDISKLQKMNKKFATLTTLFQSSGQATGQQGFLNATVTSSGGVVIGSQASGSTAASNIIKSIFSQPYNVSVLQISAAIVPMGIVSNSSSNSTSPPPLQNSPVPAPGPRNHAPATAPAKQSGQAPAPSDDVAAAPAPAATPAMPPMPDLGPSADVPAADGEGGKSAGAALGFSASGAFMIMSSLVFPLMSIF